MKTSAHQPLSHSGAPRRPQVGATARRGVIFVLSAFLLVLAFAFAAFAIDLGYITLSSGELAKTSDAAALAAVIELGDGYGSAATMTQSQTEVAARTAARDVAAMNRAAGRNSVYLDQNRDVRLGQYQYDAATATWTKSWGTTPYNLVEVTLHRDQPGSTNGDGPLGLFFAPIMGHTQANLTSQSTSALLPGKGIRVPPGSGQTADVLPIALDIGSWNNLMNGIGQDNFTYNADGTISSGPDGIREVNLYPEGQVNLPPGNRGTVDFGSSNNSTADISRQILHGLNAEDLAYFGGEISFDNGPLIINGDTGLSAGIKDELDAIRGQPRLIPIFTSVSGPGNNAMYTVVKLVGIRIMYSKLTGKPSSKVVIVQPAPFVHSSVIPGTGTPTVDSYFTPAGLVP
ncbi:MAG: TadG family pilus assembly protein [Planctomycetaceae bacterium]